MNSEAGRSLSYYLALKYPVELVECAEGGYFVKIADLPGCMSQGETAEEALSSIEEARRLWIESAHEAGDEIPLPEEEHAYSGRFLVRVPVSLHARLARAAREEGVSLNQLVLSLLAGGMATSMSKPVSAWPDFGARAGWGTASGIYEARLRGPVAAGAQSQAHTRQQLKLVG